MRYKSSGSSSSVGFSLTTIAFILSMIFMILKFCGKITWSWAMVFLPLIISVGIDIVVILVAIIIFVISNFKG